MSIKLLKIINRRKLQVLLISFTLVLSIVIPQHAVAKNIRKIFGEAVEAHNSGDFTEAIKKYNEVIPIFIENDDLINVALMYSKMGNAQLLSVVLY